MPLSTRHKITDQLKAARKALATCQYHLEYIVSLAEGQSPYIEKNVPAVLLALKEMDDVLVAFREGL